MCILTIYSSVSAIIFTGGCALFKEEIYDVMPVIVMACIAWPLIVVTFVVDYIKKLI
jgi:hypothetical protein